VLEQALERQPVPMSEDKDKDEQAVPPATPTDDGAAVIKH